MSDPHRRRPSYTTLPAPDGYRKPLLSDEVALYTCLTCGAAVMLKAVELHNTWHEEGQR
jgi:hypothetical protein